MPEADPKPRPGSKSPTCNVALWGSSQVGKTTTLAAYLGRYRPEWIVRTDSVSRDSVLSFHEVWNKLRANQLVGGTHEARLFALRHIEGFEVRFRDMRGGNTRSMQRFPEDRAALETADAVMLFVEWPGSDTAHLRAGIDALQVIPRDRPAALVITKCEGYMDQEDFALFALDPLAYLEAGLPPALAELMQEFQEHFARGTIFPITVYGWHEGRPANFYDEFGRQVPWNIKPMYVDRPFEYILDQLVLAQEVGHG